MNLKSKKICEHCGKEQDINAEKCSYCGHKFELEPETIEDVDLEDYWDEHDNHLFSMEIQKLRKELDIPKSETQEEWKKNYKRPYGNFPSTQHKSKPIKPIEKRIWNKVLAVIIILIVFSIFSIYMINDVIKTQNKVNLTEYSPLYYEFNNIAPDYGSVIYSVPNPSIYGNSSIGINCSLIGVIENYRWNVIIKIDCNKSGSSMYPRHNGSINQTGFPLQMYNQFIFNRTTKFSFVIFQAQHGFCNFNISINYICLNSTA